MRIYLAIVFASIFIVLIQSTSSTKKKKTTTTVSSSNGHVTKSSAKTATHKPSNDLPSKKCDVMDMILVLNSNEAVGRKRWGQMLHLAKDIVGRFKLGPDAVRVGAIAYSTNAKIAIPLEYKGNDVSNLINNIEYQGGSVDTDVAFEVMRAQFSTYARPNVRRIGVLISNQYSHKYDNFDKTIKQARLAREEGIELYVIGIADKYGNKEAVLSIVENPQHILKIETFDDIVSPMFKYGQSTEQLICGKTGGANKKK